MSARGTRVVVPDDLIAEIEAVVGKRRRSQFVVEAARKELLRLRQIAALRAAAGAWKREDHPELEKSADAYVRRLRLTPRT